MQRITKNRIFYGIIPNRATLNSWFQHRCALVLPHGLAFQYLLLSVLVRHQANYCYYCENCNGKLCNNSLHRLSRKRHIFFLEFLDEHRMNLSLANYQWLWPCNQYMFYVADTQMSFCYSQLRTTAWPFSTGSSLSLVAPFFRTCPCSIFENDKW